MTPTSTIATTVALVVAGVTYAALVTDAARAANDSTPDFTAAAVAATVVLVVTAAAAHGVLAVAAARRPARLRSGDQRPSDGRGDRIGGHVLATGVFGAIVMAMAGADAFWIAQVLIGAWVASELLAGLLDIRPSLRPSTSDAATRLDTRHSSPVRE